MRSNKKIALWLLSGCFLIFAMVIIGGITRLTGSGLSITEWKPVTGTLPPMSESSWISAFEKYKQSPQFKIVNSHFSLAQFKSIFWWEYIHRLLGRLIGFVFLIPFFYFLFSKQLNRVLLKKLFLLLGLGALQGFLGWFMVKSGLVNLPHVSHYRLALHLIVAFLIFGYAFHLVLELLQPIQTAVNRNTRAARNTTSVILILALVQIIYGALVAGLHGGKIYTTFPKMGDRWLASEILALHPLRTNFTENPVTVQFIHRTIAWAIGILIVILWTTTMKNKRLSQQQTNGINILFILFLFQFLLGIFTLLSAAAIPLAVLHQAGAFFLFAGILYLHHQFRETFVVEANEKNIA